jgi:hypothetical protein
MTRVKTGVALLTTLLLGSGTGLAKELTPIAHVFPTAPAGPDAVLYEVMENLTQAPTATTPRVSHWAAQGTAVAGSPACPHELIAQLLALHLISGIPASCTITAFGSDEIQLTGTGTVEVPDFATVVNADNLVDAPEGVVMTATITGNLRVVPWGSSAGMSDLTAKKAALGPSVPLVRVQGVFSPTLFGVPLTPSCFTGTFRLPFRVTSVGKPEKPVHGQRAFYLGDDGNLIRVPPEAYALGFPMLRVDVTFACPAS